jgi:hypothetical protein
MKADNMYKEPKLSHAIYCRLTNHLVVGNVPAHIQIRAQSRSRVALEGASRGDGAVTANGNVAVQSSTNFRLAD